MDRRAFLSLVGVGWVASSLPVAIVACSSTSQGTAQEQEKSTDIASTNSITIGSIADLDKAGQLLKENSPVGPVLVIRNPANPKSLLAVNPKCTHAGCTVAWKPSKKTFSCPCHFAQYDASGKVISGPAPSPLKTYQATVEGNSIRVVRG